MNHKSKILVCICMLIYVVFSARMLNNPVITSATTVAQSAFNNLQGRFIGSAMNQVNDLKNTLLSNPQTKRLVQTVSNHPVFEKITNALEVQVQKLLGSWNVIDFDNVIVNFFDNGQFTINSCNIVSCSFVFSANKFTTDGNCLSTKLACLGDKTQLILSKLTSASKLYFRPGMLINFLDDNFTTLLSMKFIGK